MHAGTNGNVEVKGPEDEGSPALSSDQQPQAASRPEAVTGKAGTSTPRKESPGAKAASAKKLAKSRKKGSEAYGEAGKPYIGLFDVSVRMDTSPPVLEFTDLREGIVGGDRTWTQQIECLVCGATIN